MTSDDARNEFKKKIECIAKIILDRRAVPFLGAGVSRPAEPDFDNLPADMDHTEAMLMHHTEAMLKSAGRCALKVAESLRTEKPKSLPPGNLLKKIEEAVQPEKPNDSNADCSGKSDRFAASGKESLGLAEVCEIALSLMGANNLGGMRELVRDVLHIPYFRFLAPTKAHRYIAFLAREGLIDEVFTTNFDCCMERAYRESFPRRPDDAVNQIYDGPSYRQKVGRPPTFGDKRRQYPRLTIFKLNGCAEAIAENRARDDTILLTERQLQDWRERQWARDLFRDRLRCRSLIFSGFGSPEPQIRHTVVQILEEMSATRNGSETPDTIPEGVDACSSDEGHRAPYVACHCEPTFHQWQIANAFCQNLGANSHLTPQALLIRSPTADSLSADDFWEQIYRHVGARVLEKLLELRSEMTVRIRRLFGVDTVVREDARLLVKASVGMDDRERRDNPEKDILGWLDEHETTRLSRWLHVMQSPPADAGDANARGIYLAIRDHGILVGDFLLVWAALVAEETAANRGIFHEEPGIGLRVDLDTDGLAVYLSGAEKCEERPMRPDEAGRGQRIALLILGPRLPGVGPAIIRPRDELPEKAAKDRKEEKVHEDRILVRLYVGEILRQEDQVIGSLQEFRKFLRNVASAPIAFYRGTQKTLRTRLARQETMEESHE